MLARHKTSSKEYGEYEITFHSQSDHNIKMLDTNNKRKSRDYTNSQKLNISLLNENCVKTEIKNETFFKEFNKHRPCPNL